MAAGKFRRTAIGAPFVQGSFLQDLLQVAGEGVLPFGEGLEAGFPELGFIQPAVEGAVGHSSL